jgi:trypsin
MLISIPRGTTSEGGKISASLRKVSVPVLDRASCQTEYKDFQPVTDNMFCAGQTKGGKDSCQGDSGGPIIDAATKTLVGLVSWGNGCAEAGFAGVYSRLGNYVDYINSHKFTS